MTLDYNELKGRRTLWTDVPEVTSDNIIQILQKVMPIFTTTAGECDYLLNFEAGIQPLQRKEPKKYRKDIDFQAVDNVANEVVEFKLGFNWGNPITLVQRGVKDSGKADEAEAIALLNECYETDGIKSKTQQLARYIEICGIGYTFVDINNEYVDGDSYFNVNVLDPRYTFVVRSSYYVDHRVMLGVTFRRDEIGNTYFTCFTRRERFEILNLLRIENETVNKWGETNRSGELNPLNMIPIIEWTRSHDRMGCFERQIDEMNNLNLLWSDFLNDTDQETQAVWHGNDIEFPEDEEGNIKTPKNGEWLITQTTPDGKTPFIKPLTAEYNYSGIIEMAVTKRDLILQKCNVPTRSEANNSTGMATSQAQGWESAESAACKEQNIIESCKMEEVKVVLSAIRKSTDVPSDSPLLQLRYCDAQPNVKRQKTYEMVTKSTTFGNLVSHGIDGLHALKAINLFDDVNQVYEDSKELIDKYQSSLFDKQTNTQSDDSTNTDGGLMAQITNSPYVDGRSNEELSKPDDNKGGE